eukprot:gene39869-49272_t
MPITGVLQAFNAVATFTFLPKKQVDPGYYSDKSTMSYRFIYENIFYESILAFQWLYMDKGVYEFLLSNQLIGGALEALWVFLPYTCIREPFFPKTHFRDSMNNKDNKSDKNQQFYAIFTQLTAVFYLFAKHYIGYMLNYMRFMNLIPAHMIKSIHYMLVAAQAATTIAMFLHTLKFKGYISGRVSFLLYVFSYSCTVVSWIGMSQVIFLSPELIAVALVGLLLNRYSNRTSHVYQVLLTVWFFNLRYGWYDVSAVTEGLSALIPAGFAGAGLGASAGL